MKRPTFVNNRLEEDVADAYSTLGHNSNSKLIDGGVSPYMASNDANNSDCDSYSDSSRRMRKKRNTYQKIPDDIRMQLLEAVQNGETLKSAAKHHKINYSSAKSILHTYRKEGRILKKSAQERTTKKRSLPNSEYEQVKPTKQHKKENVKVTENDYPYSEPFTNSKAKSDQLINHSEEASFRNPKKVLVENSNNKFSAPHFDGHGQNQPLTLSDHVHPIHKEDESTRRMLAIIENENPTEAHHTNDQVYKEENSTHKYKLTDNYYYNHQYDVPNEHVFGEGSDYLHHNFSKEYDAMHDPAVNNHRKPSHHESDHHNFGFDDKSGFLGNGFDFDMPPADPNCPFKSFMDTQRLLRDALRKASFSSFNGKYGGYRKGSVDFL